MTSHKHGLAAKTVSKWRPPKSIFQYKFLQLRQVDELNVYLLYSKTKKSKLSGVTFSLNAGGSPAMDGQASHPVKPWSQDWLIAAGAYPGFCSMKRLRVFLLPLNRMLVHHRSLPSNLLGFPPKKFAGTHLYSWVERGTVRVQCLAQEHNTMSPARA